MPGPPRKHSSERKPGDKNYAITHIDPADQHPVAAPPLPGAAHLSERTLADWEKFWSTSLTRTVVLESDVPSVVRLFHLRDQFDRALADVHDEPLSFGSQGQPVSSPRFTQMMALAKEIRSLEDRLGQSPQARLRLSIELGEASKSLDQLNARLAAKQGGGPDDDDGDIVDPRIAAAS